MYGYLYASTFIVDLDIVSSLNKKPKAYACEQFEQMILACYIQIIYITREMVR